MAEPLFSVERAKRLLQEAGLEALIVHRRQHVGYLAGAFIHHWGLNEVPYILEGFGNFGLPAPFFAGILRDPQDRPFVVGERGMCAQWKGGWMQDIRESDPRVPGKTALDHLCEAISEHGLSKAHIGLDLAYFPYPLYMELCARLPQAHFADATDLVWKLRMVKTAEELRRIREAYRTTDLVYDAVLESLRPGITIRELHQLETQVAIQQDAFLFSRISPSTMGVGEGARTWTIV